MLNVGTVENWNDGTGFMGRRLRSIVLAIVAPCLVAASLLAFSANAHAISYAVNSSTQVAGDYPELEVALSQLAVENQSDYLSKIEIDMPEGMSIHTRATEVPWCSIQDFRENDDARDAGCDPQTRVGKLVAHGPSDLARGLIVEEMSRDCRRAENDPNKLPGVPDFICIPFRNNDEASINAIMDLAMRPFENIEGNIYLGEIPERADFRGPRGWDTRHVPVKARFFVSLPFPKPLAVTDEFDTQIFGRNIGRDVPREFLKFACNIEIRQDPYIGHDLAFENPLQSPNPSDGGTKVTCLPPPENMWMSNNIELVLQDSLDDLREPQVTNPTKCGNAEFRASFFGQNRNRNAVINENVRPTTGAYVVDNCADLTFRPEGRAYWRASGPTLVQTFINQPFYEDEGREAHLKKVVVRFPDHRLHIPDERHWCEPPADSVDDCPSGTVGSVGMYAPLYGRESSDAERFWTKDNKFFGNGKVMPPENNGRRLRIVTFGHSIYNRYRIETVLEEDDDGVTMTVDNFPQIPFPRVQIHLMAFPKATNGVIQTPEDGYCPQDPVTATYYSYGGQRVEQQIGDLTVVDYSLERGGFYDCSDYREQFGGFDQPQEKPRNASSGSSSSKAKRAKKANRAKGKHKRTKSRAFRGR